MYLWSGYANSAECHIPPISAHMRWPKPGNSHPALGPACHYHESEDRHTGGSIVLASGAMDRGKLGGP